MHVVCYLTFNGQTRQSALSNGNSDWIIPTKHSSKYTGVCNLNLNKDFDFDFFFFLLQELILEPSQYLT